MNLSQQDLAVLATRELDRRRVAALAPAPPKERDPQMAPSRGLTPAITGPGRRTYLHFEAKGVALATWDDERERAPVEWLSYQEWERRCAAVRTP